MANPPKTYTAGVFTRREDLEAVLRAEVGDDANTNRSAGHTISGTREELQALGLDDTTTVFGLKCIITDTPTSKKVKKNI